MNEEEIIKYFKEVISWYRENTPDRVYALNNKDIEMIQGLLDLYNKEKEKNKKVIEMLQEHIKICGQEAIGHFNNKALKFDKHILQELLEE